ncbi:MAG: hypothetical protein DWQ34_24505 [Planctomycetota bacterium]|nr:MAG: hypothetical protein DWQ34_24505 [Planctomycetota bacterium]
MVSLEQAARFWWPGQKCALRSAREAIEALCTADWLSLHTVLSRPVDELTSPLLAWQPNDSNPDFSTLSRILHQRARAAARLTRVITVGPRVRHRAAFKLTQMTHDLHVAEVWCHYRQSAAGVRWISEDQLTSERRKGALPDALLQDDNGRILRAVEYGGDYPVERLEKLHRQMARKKLAYEIW